MDATNKAESAADFADTPQGMQQRWGMEIEASEKSLKKFHDDAKRINKRYLDKRDEYGKDESKVNLFWSTTKVLLSMLYARPPKADVSRAFMDAEDDQARVAGVIMQRILNRGFDDNVSQFDSAVRQGIEDNLTIGLGQIWARYEVKTVTDYTEPVIDPLTGAEIEPAQEYERIVDEDAPVDYVHWGDFFWSPARTWSEVRWVARRVYMNRDKLVARFGEEIANAVPMVDTTKTNDSEKGALQYDPWANAQVFEIWCKDSKKVYWFAKGAPAILDYKEDPLNLDGFFPCPKPLASNVTSEEFMPRADYIFAQDQFQELDEINTRITWLTRAAKVVGVYDKAADGVQRMFSQASENQLIPVDNWAMFAERGGIKGTVDWVPIEAVVNAINQLRQYRQDKVMQIYEVLGVSDIMRGNSRASETATAQQIKAQFGSTRVQLMQFYIADWISQALRIKAEIICKHWQPETMVRRSNIDRTPDAQIAMPAIQLLKDEALAQYRINIEADSMAALDWAAERDSAVQFMSGLGAFISQVSPMVQSTPEAGPYLLRLLQWSISKFRVAKEIEGVLDQAIASMQQSASQPRQPNPIAQAEAAEKQAGALERRAKAAKALTDAQVAAAEMGLMPAIPPEMLLQAPGQPGMPAPGPMGMPQPGGMPAMPRMPMPAPAQPNPVMQPNPNLPPAIGRPVQ